MGSGVENVTLNGQPCKVRSFNATVIHCITGRRSFISPPSVQVLVQGVGLALVNDTSSTYFSYLDRWSDLTTWLNNEPPGVGDTVIVPQGQAILVDVSPPRLKLVLVQVIRASCWLTHHIHPFYPPSIATHSDACFSD